MKRTLFLGSSPSDLSFSDPAPTVCSVSDVKLQNGKLFKEGAEELLWEMRGSHLFLDPSLLPPGVSLLDTLLWLDQTAPRDALLLYPIKSVHSSSLPEGGPWIPVVQKGDSPLPIYYLLLEMKDSIKGVAIKGEGVDEKTISLWLDPFITNKGPSHYFSFPTENFFSEWKEVLSQ